MRRFVKICFIFFCFLYAARVGAQCINSITPSCDVYQNCFSKACNCSNSPDEYFVTFGSSYCKAFMAQSDFSLAGKKWRDSTLRCLQEGIVPALPNSNGGKCDCGAAKKYALSTHVACYTNPEASVCSLPGTDVMKIATTILSDGPFKNLLKDKEDALHQALSVIDICASSAPDQGSRTIWSALRIALVSLSRNFSNPIVVNASFSTFQEASDRTVGEVESRLGSVGFNGAATNTSRSLKMDILRAFGSAQAKYGYSCFDLGCGVLIKAVIGKTKKGVKDSILDLGVLAVGKNVTDAFAHAVAINGLEAPLNKAEQAIEIDKAKSYYFWTAKGGISVFNY